MRAVIGIDRKIKHAWLDVLLDHLAQTTDPKELRRFVDERLAEELPGDASRTKSVGISLRIWSGIPANRMPLRDRAIEDLDQMALEGAVSNHISVLVELVRLFLGNSSDHGKVLPDHAEYWNQGKKKLPHKAGTAG